MILFLYIWDTTLDGLIWNKVEGKYYYMEISDKHTLLYVLGLMHAGGYAMLLRDLYFGGIILIIWYTFIPNEMW